MRAWPAVSGLAGLACFLAALPVRAEPAEPQPHHVRSFVEMGAGLALGATGYWILMDRNVADWDNPRPEARFDGSAWVLDNNSLGVNFLGHPATGALSYSFARGNHHGVPVAFGYSFLTSFVWEFVLEFKEKVSINDVLVTPGAGLPLGEFFYKLGLYLDSGHADSTGVEALRWLLGTGVVLDRKLDGRSPRAVGERDSLGFSREIWHEFAASYGVLAVDSPREQAYARYQAGVTARLVTLPGYLRERSRAGAFYGAEVSDFELAIEASRYGSGLWVQSDTLLGGYHAQHVDGSARAPRFAAVTFGTSVGFDYLRSSANRYRSTESAVSRRAPDISYHAPNRREQYGAFHLPGLALDVNWRENWGRLALSARAQPSFGGLAAPAFYDWTAAHLEERGKHILHRQGYFYGWGAATSLRARLGLGALRAGFSLDYTKYWSQDGLDRHLEQVTIDAPARGDFLSYSGSLGVAPADSVSVAVQLGVRRTRSEVGGFERTARSVERGLAATWVF